MFYILNRPVFMWVKLYNVHYKFTPCPLHSCLSVFVISSLTCMCNASSGCSPIRPSVIMTRFPASLDVCEDREEDEWRIELWRFRGLQDRDNVGDCERFISVCTWMFICMCVWVYVCACVRACCVTDLCLCMRRTLSGLMWLWEERMPLGELTPWQPAELNRSTPGTPCWDPTIYCSEYLHCSHMH